MESVNNYNKKYNLKEKLIFAKIQSEKAFQIVHNFDEIKAWNIDDFPRIFRKNFPKSASQNY